MNYFLPLLIVGSMAGGAGYVNMTPDKPADAAVFHALQTKADDITYAAHTPGSDAVCLIKRIAGTTPFTSSLQLDPDCRDVSPDLNKAVSWIDREDGTAAIVDSAGRELLLLGPSDGFAYETNAPGSPIVTLTALGKV